MSLKSEALLATEEARALYERHKSEISLHMSHLTMDYLRLMYRAFDGDLALAIVLGEIAHHSMIRYFSARGPDPVYEGRISSKMIEYERLPSCSATALARATGLPRETVRRKIVELEQRGWVTRSADRRVQITPKVGDTFLGTLNVELVERLLETAENIRQLLGRDAAT
jgi:DNA-binding transcriptional regulator YhcF (GntR family)